MKRIIVCPKGTLCDAEVSDLLVNSEVVVLQVEDPDKVRLLMPEMAVGGGDMVMALMKGIEKARMMNIYDPAVAFFDELNRRLKLAEEKQ